MRAADRPRTPHPARGGRSATAQRAQKPPAQLGKQRRYSLNLPLWFWGGGVKCKNLRFSNSRRTESEGARNMGKGREGDWKRRPPGKPAAPTWQSRRRRPPPTPWGDPRLRRRPGTCPASVHWPGMWGRLRRVGLERIGSCCPRGRWGAAGVSSGIRGNPSASSAPPGHSGHRGRTPRSKRTGTGYFALVLPLRASSLPRSPSPTRRKTRAGCAHEKSGRPQSGPRAAPARRPHPAPRRVGCTRRGPALPREPLSRRVRTQPSADPGVPGASSGATRGGRRSSRATGWGTGAGGLTPVRRAGSCHPLSLGARGRKAESAREGRKSGARSRFPERTDGRARGQRRAGWDRGPRQRHAPPRPGSAARRDRWEVPSRSPLGSS